MKSKKQLESQIQDRPQTHFRDIVPEYMSRRGFLKSGSAFGLATTLSACTVDDSPKAPAPTPESLSFKELEHDLNEHFAVAEGYDAEVLVRWGDAIFDGVGGFNPEAQSGSDQLKRFGYNNDFIGYVPLPFGSNDSNSGLLVVNHEYTIPALMFKDSPSGRELTRGQFEVDVAAHGLSVVEIQKQNGTWQLVLDSSYNRRLTPRTPMQISGAAAGSKRMVTAISKDGVHTLGTYGNCAGGVTPWGTILTGEENIDGYFDGDHKKTPEADSHERFGMHKTRRNWAAFDSRWDVEKSPNEPFHVGWIVEIDPYDANSLPKKRTALGRCKHEGCNVYISSDNRIVAYTGDDQMNEYIYKFVSKNKYQPDNREANLDLLDEGTLYAARFDADGGLKWLPLVYGIGPLTQENGFRSQADVVIDVRKAADLLGATPMDRPEDVEVNPVNGHVYAMLTKNPLRMPGSTDPANPRAFNTSGQIVDFWPESGDHSDELFSWDLFLLAGKPDKTVTKYHPDISNNGWFACPDNCAFDNLGNIWIATDGAEDKGIAEGVWACEVNGKHKALTKRFLRTPIGAELCGPFFTPDNQNFFVAVQHPAGDSKYNTPDTRWPDFDPNMPPRPSVVVITKQGGGRIGS